MNKTITILTLATISAFANENTIPSQTFGIGANVNTSFTSNFDILNDWSIYYKHKNFKSELILGYHQTKDEDEVTSYIYKSDKSISTIGVGIYGLKELDNTCLYFGAKITHYNYTTTREDNSKSESFPDEKDVKEQVSYKFTPLLGGEFFLNPHFSFGIELNYDITTYGKLKTNHSGDTSYTTSQKLDQSEIATNSRVKATFYW